MCYNGKKGSGIFAEEKRMKNSIKLFAASLIIVSIVFAFLLNASTVLAGDVDKNGKVQASDARLVLRHVAKLQTLSKEQEFIADVDQNGKVTAADARLILRMVAKLDKEFELTTKGSVTTTKPTTTTKPSGPTTTLPQVNLVTDNGAADGEITLFGGN